MLRWFGHVMRKEEDCCVGTRAMGLEVEEERKAKDEVVGQCRNIISGEGTVGMSSYTDPHK